MRLFIERGYAQVNMDMIARTAGVALRTIYAQFGGKHGLLRKIIERERERDNLRAALLCLTDLDPERTLAEIAFNLLRQTLSPKLRLLHADATATRDAELAQQIGPEQCGPWRRALGQCFATDAWTARYGVAVHLDTLCDMFVGCVEGAQARARMTAPRTAVEQGELRALADLLTRKFLTAIAAPR
jgi:TetR/AcrR family transcriptional repressor of mexJK operon